MVKSSNFILGCIARTLCTLVFVHIQERFSNCSIFASLTHIRCCYCIRRLWGKFLRKVFACYFYQNFPQVNHSLKQNPDSNTLSNRFPNIALFFLTGIENTICDGFFSTNLLFYQKGKISFHFSSNLYNYRCEGCFQCVFLKLPFFLKKNLKFLRDHHCKMSFSGPIRKRHLAQWHFTQNQRKRVCWEICWKTCQNQDCMLERVTLAKFN